MTQNSSQRARGRWHGESVTNVAMIAFRLMLPSSQDFYLKIVLDDLSQTSVRFRWRESVGRRIVGFNVFSPKLNCMESLPMVLLASQESVARAATRDQHLRRNAQPSVAETVN